MYRMRCAVPRFSRNVLFGHFPKRARGRRPVLSLTSSAYWNATTPSGTKTLETTSTITSVITQNPCGSGCSATYPYKWSYTWQREEHDTTITAATVVYVVNTRTNATRTVTKYNELPAGYTLPPVNAAGTRITILTIPHGPSGNTTTTL